MTESQKQLIREKFDTFAENLIINFGTNQETEYLTDIWADAYRKINDFMFSQIDLAIKQTEERMVEKIEEMRVIPSTDNSGDYYLDTYKNNALDEIITLIRNK